MSRTRLSTVLAGSVAFGALSLLPLSPASAEPTFTPASDDIVGVGSDTTQFAMNYLIDGATIDTVAVPGYNAGRTSARLVSFDAIGDGLSSQITPKEGATAITRPNGSGAGKSLLYGAGNNTSIDYARSSSALSDAEVSGGLWAMPFAVDGLKLAVDATSTHAPAFVSPTDLVKIYNGTYTDWSQLGGSAGTIHPLIPQAGSGTRSFFLAQLKVANGGTDVALAGSVKETQEHSDTDIKADPDAVAPFSTGRAKTTPTIKLLGGTAVGGFEAKRALYNVVRQADLNSTWFASIFGPDGFICSTAAKPLIEKAGFDQLARSASGGVCGEPTQSATSNFTTNTESAAQATTTTLAATVVGQQVTLKSTSTAANGTPEGSVQLFDGATSLGTRNLSGGVALLSLSGVKPGIHSYHAAYTSTSSLFENSVSANKSVTVKYPSKTSVTMPGTFSATQRVKAAISVVAGGKPAAGKVKVLDGTKRLLVATLTKGKVTVLLPRLTRGKHTLTFAYLGNASTATSKVAKKVSVTR